MPALPKVRSLTIFLLKKGVTEENALDEGADTEVRTHSVSVEDKEIGILHARQTPLAPPAWVGMFGKNLTPPAKLNNASVSAIYLTKAAGRLFALAFGHGRHLLRAGSFEERFGLRATLNSVHPDFLRSVDVTTLESNPFHAKRQASRASPLGEFGLNLDQDILRAVAGTPTDEKLGTHMTGIDSLSVRVRADLNNLRPLLKRYLEKSEDGAYRERFPWVDHVAEVRDEDLKTKLFNRMMEVLEKKADGHVWAAIPEIVDWATFDCFRIGSPSAKIAHDDVRLDALLDSFEGEAPTLEILRRRRVFCMMEGSPHPRNVWSYLQCLTAEIPVDGTLHILNAGTWYRVSSSFVHDVDAAVDDIPATVGGLPVWGDEHEKEYNQRVSGQSAGKYALMDRVMVTHSGMPSPIEFCDLYSTDRRLIHVKKYGQSSILSHLFMQGLVSANCLLSDAQFRDAVNVKLPASHRLPNPADRPSPAAFEIAFAIGSSESGKLNLPFFSRVTLRNVERTLTQSFGYRVTLTKISLNKLADLSAPLAA